MIEKLTKQSAARHRAAKPPAKPKASPQLKVKPKQPAVAPDHRVEMVKWALWGAANEPQIHYAQTRPIPVTAATSHLPLTTDCSGFATICAKWAGAPDPNGRHFDGQGYTGTLLDHCQHIPLSQVRPGDLVVYGPHPGHHVCVVVGLVKDKAGHTVDLQLVSHGQEKGPVRVMNSIEQQFQPYPETFLSFI